MAEISKSMKALNKQEVFEQLKKILYEVAPSKIVHEITMNSSLTEDFGFDSINIVDTFLKAQERFINRGNTSTSFEKFLSDGISGLDTHAMVVESICDYILEKSASINSSEELNNG